VLLPSQSDTREPLNVGDQLDPLDGKLDGIVQQLKELKDLSEKVWLLQHSSHLAAVKPCSGS